jgi:hypothetical protein
MAAQHGQLVLQGREAVFGGQQFLHGLAVAGLIADCTGLHHAFAIDQQTGAEQAMIVRSRDRRLRATRSF